MPAAPRSSALLLCLALGACHHAPGPEQVLDTYFARLRRGDIEGAYALTTPAFRARRSLAAFSLLVARQPVLDGPEAGVTQRSLTVELAAAGATPLRVIGARTARYLAEDPLDLYPATSAEATLRSFARAVALGRRDRIVVLIAPHLRERLGAATEPLPDPLAVLARKIDVAFAAGATVLTDGATARWLTGDGVAVTLERTGTGWSIAAFE